MDESPHHQAQFRFDDGGMRGLAAALCWCGIVYFASTLKDDELCGGSRGIPDLARSLLDIPTYYRTPGPDPTRSMIARIIRQNVESKKLAVSSWEWAQILQSLSNDGQKMSVDDAVELYNMNPEVAAHGGGSAKDLGSLNFEAGISQVTSK